MKRPILEVVARWLFRQLGHDIPTPSPATQLAYRFINDEKAGGWRLVVEMPVMEQTPFQGWGQRHSTAHTEFAFVYLLIVCESGLIRRQYSKDRLRLEDLNPAIGDVVGWTFLLGAIELVNGNQFEGHFYPPNWHGFSPLWDIASIMQDGDRALFSRSAFPQAVMLKFTNQLRMLLAPIQAAQRPNLEFHIRLMKILTNRSDEDKAVQRALTEVLGEHYAENFRPPELLF